MARTRRSPAPVSLNGGLPWHRFRQCKINLGGQACGVLCCRSIQGFQGMPMILDNYVSGRWMGGEGDGVALRDPVLGTELARASTEGIDMAAALDYARAKGTEALRQKTYAERAALLTKIVETLTANRAAYFEIALANSGSPEADAAIDIDGAIF